MPTVVGTAGWASGVAGGGVPVWEVPRDSGDGLTWYTSFEFATWAYNIYGVIVIIERSTGVSHVLNPFIGQFTSDSANQLFTLDASEALGAGDSIHCIYWPKQPVIANPNLEARLFGGSGNNLEWGALSPHFLINDMSVGMWIKLSSSVIDNELLVQRGWGGGSITAYQLRLKTSPTEWSIEYHHDNASDVPATIVITPPGGLPEDRWFYLGMSRDVSAQTATIFWIYEDGTGGQATGSWAGQVDPGGSDTSPGQLQFGGDSHITLQEHYLSSALWSASDHDAARLGNPPLTGLVLSCRVLGNSPELDESGTGASGTVTGTTLVPGHA